MVGQPRTFMMIGSACSMVITGVVSNSSHCWKWRVFDLSLDQPEPEIFDEKGLLTLGSGGGCPLVRESWEAGFRVVSPVDLVLIPPVVAGDLAVIDGHLVAAVWIEAPRLSSNRISSTP